MNIIPPSTYQEYLDQLKKHRGLGDTVAAITQVTGIDKLFSDNKTGQPCASCQQRRESWNRRWPYK